MPPPCGDSTGILAQSRCRSALDWPSLRCQRIRMKFLIASLAAVSVMAADGFAQSLSTGALGGSSGARTQRADVPDRYGQLLIGDFVWQGVRYPNAQVSMNADAESVTISTLATKPLELPWEKVPAWIQARLSPLRAKMLVKLREAAGQRDAGIETRIGNVIGRTPTGFLVADRVLVFHVTGKTELTDGELFHANLRRDGVYQYTSTVGALSTVKNYVPIP